MYRVAIIKNKKLNNNSTKHVFTTMFHMRAKSFIYKFMLHLELIHHQLISAAITKSKESKMKIVILFSFLHLLIAFSSCNARITTPNQLLPPLVRDNQGEILTSDSRYFMLPGAGGGGVTRDLGNGTETSSNFVCPFQVVQSRKDLDPGMPVFLKPRNNQVKKISESTSLNIKFYLNPTFACADNLVWMVEGFPGTQSPFFLSTNGVEGDPLQMTSWFQVKKFNDHPTDYSYKLVFFPWGESFCSDIGIEVVDRQRRLALTLSPNNTYRFVFVKDISQGISII